MYKKRNFLHSFPNISNIFATFRLHQNKQILEYVQKENFSH